MSVESNILIHSEKFYLYSSNFLEKKEKLEKVENVINYLKEVIETHGTREKEIQPLKGKCLLYHIYLKHNKKLFHIEIHALYSLLLDTRSIKVKRMILNADSYLISKFGALKIHLWLFGGDDECEKTLTIPLKGHRAEVINHVLIDPMKDEDWSNQFYKPLYKEIHPFVVAYVTKLSHGSTSSVLELCAGDGSLAKEIFSTQKISSYILVERNKKSASLAEKLLENYINSQNAEVIVQDLSITPLNKIVDGSFDFVIGSGALTRAVLSDEVAKKVFAQVSNMINPGGYIILTGAEYSWIDAAMMRNKGFHVLNTFCPQIGKQLYVAQKPKLSFL